MSGATGDLLAELAEELAHRGWEVTVVTSGRNEAPVGTAAVRVKRCGGLAFTRASHWRRALSYGSLYPVFFWNVLRLPRTGVIVTLTDPPLHLVLGPFLKLFKRSKLVHWAQDVYPEIAEELGVIRKGGMRARVLRGLSTWALRRCDLVVAVGECMKKRLAARGVSGEKIAVISNWSLKETAGAGTSGASADFRRVHSLGDKFVVMYSGNFGLAHQFDAIVEAAARLQSSDPEILFVFVGDGPKLPWLREKTGNLSNVRFLPFQPPDKLRASLGSADLHLVSMRRELEGLVVPSKAYGVFAAGRPCIFLGPPDSEVARMILRHECGEVMDGMDGIELAKAIVRWKEDPRKQAEARRNAENASREMTVSAAAKAFDTALRPGARMED